MLSDLEDRPAAENVVPGSAEPTTGRVGVVGDLLDRGGNVSSHEAASYSLLYTVKPLRTLKRATWNDAASIPSRHRRMDGDGLVYDGLPATGSQASETRKFGQNEGGESERFNQGRPGVRPGTRTPKRRMPKATARPKEDPRLKRMHLYRKCVLKYIVWS